MSFNSQTFYFTNCVVGVVISKVPANSNNSNNLLFIAITNFIYLHGVLKF